MTTQTAHQPSSPTSATAHRGCREATPVRFRTQTVALDCEGNKILDMYGLQGRYKALGDVHWTETPIVIYPGRCIDVEVPIDGEIEFQWRSLRHGVKWQPGDGSAAVYSTVPSPWSESTIVSIACAAPVQGDPATVEMSPGCIH
jgi:hypothetical protein